MNDRTRIPIAAAILAATLLSAGAVLAQGGPPPGGPPPEGRGGMRSPGGPPPGGPRGEWGPPEGRLGLRLPPPEALDRLGLTDAQRARIDDLLEAEQRQSIRGESEARIAELDLQKLIESDAPDQAAIARTIEKLSGIRQEMLKARVLALVNLRGVLTPAQRKKLRPPPGEAPPWH